MSEPLNSFTASRWAEAVVFNVRELERAESDEADWWYHYICARIALRQMALVVISSPKHDTHPDRRSADFKFVSQDIIDDMKTVLDPDHNCVPCPVCGEMTLGNDCVVCWMHRKRRDND